MHLAVDPWNTRKVLVDLAMPDIPCSVAERHEPLRNIVPLGGRHLMSAMGWTLAGVGVFLVVVGVILTAVQLLRPVPGVSAQQPARRGMAAKAGPVKVSLKTTFPGLILVACGVLLLAVEAIVK